MKRKVLPGILFMLLVVWGFAVSTTDVNAQSCTGTATFTVNIGSVPAQPGTITGVAGPCLETQTYSVTNTSGVSYNWTVTGGTVASGQGTNSVSVNWTGTGAQTLTVTPSNTCGSGTARTLSVTVGTVPAQPSLISGNLAPCIGSASYSVTSVSGVTYNWSVTGGTITSGQGTNSVSINWTGSGAQTLSVTPSNACGNGTLRSSAVTVNTVPSQPSTITGTAFSCTDDVAASYSVTNVGGVTYTWSVSGGGSVTPSGNTASVDWTTAGSYVLTVVPSNTCGNGTSRTLNVTVETTPAPAINGVADACATVQQTYTVPFTSGNTYSWTVSANGTIISGQGTNSIVVEWNSGTIGTVSVTETNN